MSDAGQRLGVDMATNFMLMTLFNIAAGTTEDPDGVRADVKTALLGLIDQYSLQGVAPETAREERGEVKANGGARNFTAPNENSEIPSAADIGLSREAAKLVIAGILQDPTPLKQ